MAYAELPDVVGRIGRPIAAGSPEAEQVTLWLDDAEGLIRRRIKNLDALIVSEDIDLKTVIKVEAQAVIRKVRNPDGKVSEDIDDYRYRLNADAARVEVYISADEWDELLPGAEPAEGAGAYSVVLGKPWGTG